MKTFLNITIGFSVLLFSAVAFASEMKIIGTTVKMSGKLSQSCKINLKNQVIENTIESEPGAGLFIMNRKMMSIMDNFEKFAKSSNSNIIEIIEANTNKSTLIGVAIPFTPNLKANFWQCPGGGLPQ